MPCRRSLQVRNLGLIVFCPQDNPRSTAIKAVAKANDLELNLVEVDFAKPTPEHLKAHKLGKIPAFVGEDGFALSESIAIAIYRTSKFSLRDRPSFFLLLFAQTANASLRDDLAFHYTVIPV